MYIYAFKIDFLTTHLKKKIEEENMNFEMLSQVICIIHRFAEMRNIPLNMMLLKNGRTYRIGDVSGRNIPFCVTKCAILQFYGTIVWKKINVKKSIKTEKKFTIHLRRKKNQYFDFEIKTIT